MIDKSDIRKQILSEIDKIEFDNKLIGELNALTATDENNNLHMKRFYSDFNSILSWGEINSIQYQFDSVSTSDTLKKVININAWAKNQWIESITSGNLYIAVISFIIIDKLFLKPEEDLPWNFDFSTAKKKLNNVLQNLKFEISNKLPDYAGYSDIKFHSDYQKAIETNNYKGIFIFFNAIERGIGLHSEEEEFIKALLRISSLIDLNILSANIENFSPPLMYLVTQTLNKNVVLELLGLYNNKNILPLLMGLKRIFEHERNQQKNENDWIFIEKCSDILAKINDETEEDSLYKFVSESIGNPRSKIWHLSFTAYIAKNENYFNDYSENIDFTYDLYGEESFDTFKQFATDDNLDVFSIKIFKDFNSYIKKMKYQQHPFFFSSYYKYFLHGISVISNNDYLEYLHKLEMLSVSLMRCLYSWDLNERDQYFNEWIYWIIAVKNLTLNSENDVSQFVYTNKILSDERIMSFLKIEIGNTVINFNELKSFFENPNSINKIILPFKEKAIELCWLY